MNGQKGRLHCNQICVCIQPAKRDHTTPSVGCGGSLASVASHVNQTPRHINQPDILWWADAAICVPFWWTCHFLSRPWLAFSIRECRGGGDTRGRFILKCHAAHTHPAPQPPPPHCCRHQHCPHIHNLLFPPWHLRPQLRCNFANIQIFLYFSESGFYIHLPHNS